MCKVKRATEVQAVISRYVCAVISFPTGSFLSEACSMEQKTILMPERRVDGNATKN